MPRSPRAIRAALLLVLTGGLTEPLQAQSTEFRLDGGTGSWEAAPVAPLTPDQEIMVEARRSLADGKPYQAINALDPWIEANQTSQHPLLPQAYLLRADAKTAASDEYEALYDYEKVAIDYPGTEEFARAVERELEIALKYVNGMKRRWLGMRIVGAEDVGEELLVRVQERMPGSRLAERAAIELADYYYRNRNLKLASDAYEIFITNFPASPHVAKAKQRRIGANIGRFKGPDYDASGLVEGKILIEDYAATDAAGAQRAGLSDALMARLDESTAAQLLSKARYYLKRNDPVSARHTLLRLVRSHPETVSAARGGELLREHGWEIADAKPAAPDTAPAAESPPAPPPPATEEANP